MKKWKRCINAFQIWSFLWSTALWEYWSQPHLANCFYARMWLWSCLAVSKLWTLLWMTLETTLSLRFDEKSQLYSFLRQSLCCKLDVKACLKWCLYCMLPHFIKRVFRFIKFTPLEENILGFFQARHPQIIVWVKFSVIFVLIHF